MKQYKWIVAGLTSLLIGSWMLLYHYYQTSKKGEVKVPSLVERIVAVHTIPEGTKIEQKNLARIKIDAHTPFAIQQPPMNKIIGQYSTRTIYPGEMITADIIRSVKLVKKRLLNQKSKHKETEVSNISKNSVLGAAIPTHAFQNPDIPLTAGSHIDILAVTLKKDGEKPYVHYAAINIPVLGFIRSGRVTRSYHLSQPKNVKKGYVATPPDYLLLDLPPNALINVMQKGYQSLELNGKRVFTVFKKSNAHLWIVPSSEHTNADKAIKRLKLRSLKGENIAMTHKNTYKKIRKHNHITKKTLIHYEK